MFDLFKAKAEAVSAEVHRVADRDAARELVMRVLDRERVEDAPGARAVWREGTLLGPLDQDVLATRAPGLSFEVTRERAADSRVGVTESTAHRPDVLAAYEHAGSGEVTQIVQTHAQSELVADPTESQRHVVGSPRGSIGNVMRENIRVIAQDGFG